VRKQHPNQLEGKRAAELFNGYAVSHFEQILLFFSFSILKVLMHFMLHYIKKKVQIE